MNPEKILLVDDDTNLLAGLTRVLRAQFKLFTAAHPIDGLKTIGEKGPFEVIIADMRMPGMDGIAFLTETKKIAPDSIRLLLTGDTSVDTATKAVNQGEIFRFLVKPCAPEVIAAALNAAIERYRLLNAERGILGDTLNGCATVLLDILSMARPAAFSRSRRFSHYVRQVTASLRLRDAWRYELAALFSQLGFIAVPEDTLARYYQRKVLSNPEKRMILEQANVARELLQNIPNLGGIPPMLDFLRPDDPPQTLAAAVEKNDNVAIGKIVLRTVNEFDLLMSAGMSKSDAVANMLREEKYDKALLTVLYNLDVTINENMKRLIKVAMLREGMVLAENVTSKDGRTLLAEDTIVNQVVRESLTNYWKQGLINEAVSVYSTQKIGQR